jgi:hypothetical protein
MFLNNDNCESEDGRCGFGNQIIKNHINHSGGGKVVIVATNEVN